MANTVAAESNPKDRPDPEAFLPIHKEAGLDPFADRPLNIILTLEGGGAKGIVHLGAYRELERALKPKRDQKYDHWPKYVLRGLSGTSIGALVAAMIAVGYSSLEMIPELPAPPRLPEPPISEGRWFGWLSWTAFRILHSWALVMYSMALLTGAARSTVLQNAGLKKVTDVFGRGVLRFLFLRFLFSRPIIMCLLLTVVWIASVLLVYIVIVDGYPVLHDLFQVWGLSGHLPDFIVSNISSLLKFFSEFRYAPVISMILFGLMSAVLLAGGLRCLLRGLLSTEPFTKYIDRALAVKLLEKLQERATDQSVTEAKRKKIIEHIEECRKAINRPFASYLKVVTFQMIRDADQYPLAVAATNIKSGLVELFSTDATPKIFVADAVAASAAVPLLFQPVQVEGDDKNGLYLDGGFTSNLPAWPYDAQREINPDLYTVTIEIRGQGSLQSWTTWRFFKPFQHFAALITAAVFGARELETRRTRRAAVQLDTQVRLLDFDMGPKRANDEIEWSRRAFRTSLNNRAAMRKLYADKCLRICQAVQKHLTRKPAGDTTPRIRVSLLQPTRYGARALKTVWRFCSLGSFRCDTDDRLLFRKDTSIPGKAWETLSPVLERISRDPSKVIWIESQKPDHDIGSRHRYAHRLLWDQIEWMLAVPKVRDWRGGRGSTDWVIVVDSNIPLDDFEFCDGSGQAFRNIQAAIAEIAGELWSLEDNTEQEAAKLEARMTQAA
jgi:predicted acylesterase/phospholipase RssA